MQAVDPTALPAWFDWALRHPGRSRFIEVNGRRLHYLEWGSAAKGLPVLLLVHGLRGHAHWWDGIAPFFIEGYRVIALDLSGMGDSDPRLQYPNEYGALDIVDLIECAALGSVVGIGHSYGGSRLLRACADRPDLFQRLVVLDSFLLLPDVEIPIDNASAGKKRVYPDLCSGLSRYRLMPPQPGSVEAVLNNIARHSLREEDTGWCWKFDPNLPRGAQQEDLAVEMLPRVRRPVDVVFGECSAVVSPAAAREAVALLPKGRGPHGLPGTHHHMMIDQPLAVIAMLRGLLAAGVEHE